MIILGDWLSTAEGVVTLITGLIGLITTGIGAFFAIKNFLKVRANKTASENWGLIMEMADAAMKEAEASGKKGADKKELVVNSVKASCKAAGVNMDEFIDQLSNYIDQTISFVNSMKK